MKNRRPARGNAYLYSMTFQIDEPAGDDPTEQPWIATEKCALVIAADLTDAVDELRRYYVVDLHQEAAKISIFTASIIRDGDEEIIISRPPPAARVMEIICPTSGHRGRQNHAATPEEKAS